MDKIKNISYENDIFKNIKEEIKKINKLLIKSNEISFDNSKIINASVSLNMFDAINENKNKFNNFSFVNEDFNNF